jgi:hypothetical protein
VREELSRSSRVVGLVHGPERFGVLDAIISKTKERYCSDKSGKKCRCRAVAKSQISVGKIWREASSVR